jgi:hypothetical protein
MLTGREERVWGIGSVTACCCAACLLVQGGVLLELSSLLAAYQARNVTTVYNNRYPVWQVGDAQKLGVHRLISTNGTDLTHHLAA